MAINKSVPGIKNSVQNDINWSFDEDYGVLVSEQLGHDGQNVQRQNADALATKITTVGSITYIGIAAPGTAQATAKWQATKYDYTDINSIIISYAEGGAFNQIATDLTLLSYS